MKQEGMYEYLSIGTILYHKYLSNVTIVELGTDRIKADTGSRGILDFAFYDFGKVLFFEKSHSANTFESYKKYLEFCDEEKRKKIIEEEKARQECEAKRLLQMKELEKKEHFEIEQQTIINEEKKKQEQLRIQLNNPISNKLCTREKLSPWSNAINLSSLMEEFFPNRETLLRIKRDHEDKIKEIIEQRKIEYLVHFTRIDNLLSILQNGLIPVSIQQKMKIPSVHNDEQRIDSKLDCTSCSVVFPNYKLFYTFRESKFPSARWAIIVLDKDVLFSPSNIAYYCQTNAAGVFPRLSSAKELCTAKAFENMFCDSIITKENKLIQRTSLQISDRVTTDPQAEVLISDIIDTKYIGCVCFQNQSDIDAYLLNNGPDVLNKYDYQIIPAFFAARKDYMFWKKEC